MIQRLADELLPKWLRERERLDRIDRWARWSHDDPHRPKQATPEYKELAQRSQAPWGDLIVSSVAQTLYVDGYRSPSRPEDLRPWGLWTANRLRKAQVGVHRGALTYGLAYGLSLPGVDRLTGTRMPIMRGVSARQMLALYADPGHDEWPEIVVDVVVDRGTWNVHVYDDALAHHLVVDGVGARPRHLGWEPHETGVPPVVRYTNRLDLEGRNAGEIEPFISVLGRIDQTVFDRLVVQRFASWVVRTIAGMSTSKTAAANGVAENEVALRLRVEDLLTADDPNTKFGSLPATPLEGFIAAHDDDLQSFAAVSQTPAHEVLGINANLSADALAAADRGRDAKSEERQLTFGEDHAQFIRLGCHQAGWEDAARDFVAQVRWRDTRIQSLASAADALGKLATMLGIPVQVLWPKVPGMDQQDLDEAKALVRETAEEVLDRVEQVDPPRQLAAVAG